MRDLQRDGMSASDSDGRLDSGFAAGHRTHVPAGRRAPAGPPAPQPPGTKRLLLAVALPMLLAPAIGVLVFQPFLPVLVADYLLLHFALFAAIQLAVLRRWPLRRGELSWSGLALLLTWGLLFIGAALDRYAASFLPTAERLLVILALSLATVPFMLADSLVSGAGRGRWWQRLAARAALPGVPGHCRPPAPGGTGVRPAGVPGGRAVLSGARHTGAGSPGAPASLPAVLAWD